MDVSDHLWHTSLYLGLRTSKWDVYYAQYCIIQPVNHDKSSRLYKALPVNNRISDLKFCFNIFVVVVF